MLGSGPAQARDAAEAPPQEEAPAPRERLPLSAALYLRRGLEYAARPRPDDQREAERLFRKALALAPDDARAHAGLARISVYLYTLGEEETAARLEAALGDARRAVALAPDEPRARTALALALAAANRLAGAEEEARRAVALDGGSGDAWAVLSQVLRLRGDLVAALEAARRAATLDPGDPRALVAMGDALRDQEHLTDAMEMYGQAVDLDHEAVVPQLAAAATLMKGGRLGLARGTYNLLLEHWDYGGNRALLGAAALLVAGEDYEGALEMYGRVPIPDNASHPTILALYGKAWCLLRLGREAEAEYFLSTLITRVTADWDGPARAREILFLAYDDLARFFDGRDRQDKAVELRRAAAARPLAPTRVARALASGAEGRRGARDAVQLLARALLGSDPGEDPIELADTALLMARLAGDGGGRQPARNSPAAAALRLAADRIAASPHGAAHYRLARARALAADPAGALESLQRARDCGYLPAEQAAVEPDLAALRGLPAFRGLLDQPND